MAGGIGSKAMLTEALREVGVPPRTAKDYSLRALVRPGSDIIDAQLRGPDPSILRSLAPAYARASTRWSADHYAAYDLNFLETIATPGPVYPRAKRMYGLGFVLGGLLGLLVVYLESQLTSGRYRLRRRLLGVAESEVSQDEPSPGPTHRDGEPVRELVLPAQLQEGSAETRPHRSHASGQGRSG